MDLVVFHPSPNLVSVIDGLFHEIAPMISYKNVIVPDLLDRVISDGPTKAIQSEVARVVLESSGTNTLILCTCSTLGGIAESVTRPPGTNVIRIDRPMAELAVATGSRIGVAAALESTLKPTRDLLLAVAKSASKNITISEFLFASAWKRKQLGDDKGYIEAVAYALSSNVRDIDVLVLAQGSMAPAQDLVTLPFPILSSPEIAVRRVCEIIATDRE